MSTDTEKSYSDNDLSICFSKTSKRSTKVDTSTDTDKSDSNNDKSATWSKKREKKHHIFIRHHFFNKFKGSASLDYKTLTVTGHCRQINTTTLEPNYLQCIHLRTLVLFTVGMRLDIFLRTQHLRMVKMDFVKILVNQQPLW